MFDIKYAPATGVLLSGRCERPGWNQFFYSLILSSRFFYAFILPENAQCVFKSVGSSSEPLFIDLIVNPR